MLSQSLPVLAAFSSGQVLALTIVTMGIGFLVVVSLAGIIAPAWVSVTKVRLETALKQQMVERGMSAAEIVTVLDRPPPEQASVNYPCASEVVVECDGEWSPALILKREGERYLVHRIGTEMSENAWLTTDRIRFPASKTQDGSPWDWTVPAEAFDRNHWCANSSKQAPVDAEL